MPDGTVDAYFDNQAVTNLSVAYSFEAGASYIMEKTGGDEIYYMEVSTSDPDPTVSTPLKHRLIRLADLSLEMVVESDTQFFGWSNGKAVAALSKSS